MVKIFTDISDEIRALQAQLEEHAEANAGDVSAFPLLDHLGDLEKLQADRAGQGRMLLDVACLVLEYEGEASAIRAQAVRIAEAADKVDARAKAARAFIASKLGPTDKVRDDRVSLSMRKSEAVEIQEGLAATDLPLEYQRVKIEADKAALSKAVKAGVEVAGISLVTRHNLQIK